MDGVRGAADAGWGVNAPDRGEAIFADAIGHVASMRSPRAGSGTTDGDTVRISAEGREKARGRTAGDDGDESRRRTVQGAGLPVDKNEVVGDLQDTESDIRRVKDRLGQVRVEPGGEEERTRQEKALKLKLETLEDEARDLESSLSR